MDETTPLKCCKKCSRSFPATPEFFSRHKYRKDGLYWYCKECKNAPRRLPQIETEAIPEGMKKCSKCKNILPATNDFFTRHNQKKDGLSPSCKMCRHAYSRAYNSSDVAQNMRKQYEQEHRAEINERSRRYRNEHKEVINTKYRQFFKTDRGKIAKRAKDQRRRARKKHIEANLTTEQIQQKLKAQRYRCYYAACGHAKFETVNGKYIYHLEHTIPVSRTEAQPRHDVNYVVLACPTCNMRKGTKLPHEWNEGGRLF